MIRHLASLTAALLILLALGGAPRQSHALARDTTSTAPQIGLFESVERVRAFLEEEAVEDYTGTHLSGVSLHLFDGTPRSGLAWVYTFSYDPPRLGGEPCILHFMDGEILEIRLGP